MEPATTVDNNNQNQKPRIILPVKDKRNILVTSALPYVNNVPHLGNIIGCVLSADVYARYCRLRGYNVLYICGTDEYGTATETKALQEGLTPMEICNKYHAIHKEIYEWFNISFDHFGRTTTKYQTEIAQDIFNKLYANGYTLEEQVEQVWCDYCNRFLADRYIEGTCPRCSFVDARGDQCDGCGHLLNATELLQPRCKVCFDRIKKQLVPTATNPTPAPAGNLIRKNSTHLFLDIPRLEPKLRDFVQNSSSSGIWTANSVSITQGWFKTGLKPRCITRDLKWGTPVPIERFSDKVFYVWFDAPIGYISITADYTPENWKQWWKTPENNVEYVEFMGKDNIPFHTIIFPSSLLATHENWTLLKSISTTEYLNYENTQFSKGRGTGVFGDNAKTCGVDSFVFRYYLLSIRPETGDSEFLWNDFITKNNSELLANLGNFLNRALKFISQNFDNKIPAAGAWTDKETKLVEDVNVLLTQYLQEMEKFEIREGLRTAMKISTVGNGYLQEEKPWTLVGKTDEDKIRCGTILNLAVNLARLVSIIVEPFVPDLSEEVWRQLGVDYNGKREGILGEKWTGKELEAGKQLGNVQPMVKLIPPAKAEEWRKQFGGSQAERENKEKEEKAKKDKKKARGGKKELAPVGQEAGKKELEAGTPGGEAENKEEEAGAPSRTSLKKQQKRERKEKERQDKKEGKAQVPQVPQGGKGKGKGTQAAQEEKKEEDKH